MPVKVYLGIIIFLQLVMVWRIGTVKRLLLASAGREKSIMADLTAITAQVAQNTTVEESAVTLIKGLAAQIQAAGTDPAALQALVTQLNGSATDLAAAVAANTPAA